MPISRWISATFFKFDGFQIKALDKDSAYIFRG